MNYITVVKASDAFNEVSESTPVVRTRQRIKNKPNAKNIPKFMWVLLPIRLLFVTLVFTQQENFNNFVYV